MPAFGGKSGPGLDIAECLLLTPKADITAFRLPYGVFVKMSTARPSRPSLGLLLIAVVIVSMFAVNLVEADLISTGPTLIPRHIDLVRDLIAVHHVSTRVREQGPK